MPTQFGRSGQLALPNSRPFHRCNSLRSYQRCCVSVILAECYSSQLADAGAGRSQSMFERVVDALLDGFVPRVQRHLMVLRLLFDLRAACRGGLLRGRFVGIGHRRRSGRRGYERDIAHHERDDYDGAKRDGELSHGDLLFLI